MNDVWGVNNKLLIKKIILQDKVFLKNYKKYYFEEKNITHAPWTRLIIMNKLLIKSLIQKVVKIDPKM